jgi:serine/threonine protein phosphatase PrpC
VNAHRGKAVSCDPTIPSFEPKNGMWPIIACDGFWDVMKDQKAANTSKAIRDESLLRASTDNVSWCKHDIERVINSESIRKIQCRGISMMVSQGSDPSTFPGISDMQ